MCLQTGRQGTQGRKKGMFLEYFATNKEKQRYSECNLPPITKLKSLIRRISHQWAGGKVHGLDIGMERAVIFT